MLVRIQSGLSIDSCPNKTPCHCEQLANRALNRCSQAPMCGVSNSKPVVLQAQVREQHMFARPLPIETVLPILPRIPGRPGTSFEQHLDRDQVCKVYDAFVRHNQS